MFLSKSNFAAKLSFRLLSCYRKFTASLNVTLCNGQCRIIIKNCAKFIKLASVGEIQCYIFSKVRKFRQNWLFFVIYFCFKLICNLLFVYDHVFSIVFLWRFLNLIDKYILTTFWENIYQGNDGLKSIVLRINYMPRTNTH